MRLDSSELMVGGEVRTSSGSGDEFSGELEGKDGKCTESAKLELGRLPPSRSSSSLTKLSGATFAGSRGKDDCPPSRSSRFSSVAQRLLVDMEGFSEKSRADKSIKPAFLDAAATKEKVRQALFKSKYNVCDFYHERGLWQAIARNFHFERLTLAVIGLNAMWIAVDTDFNNAEAGFVLNAHWVFQLAENGFCTFYSFELLVRFMSFRNKMDGFRDYWFSFDFSMAVLMVCENWIFTAVVLLLERGQEGRYGSASLVKMAKLVRLFRMCRMIRLLRFMPELMIMVKGIIAAFKSVFFTIILITGLLFVFAIAFTQLTMRTVLGDMYFRSVRDSMYFLMVHGALLLSADYMAVEIHVMGGSLCLALFFLFILFAAVLLMNMLIGVLCEVVSAVAIREKEEMLVTFVGAKIEKVMAIIDEDGGGTISRDEFMLILDNLEAMEALHDVGVDVVGLVDFADFIFGDETGVGEVELTLPEFMEVILQLRGSNTATVKDIVDMRKFVCNELNHTTKQIAVAQQKLALLSDMVESAHLAWEANVAIEAVGREDGVGDVFEKQEASIAIEAVGREDGVRDVFDKQEASPALSLASWISNVWNRSQAPNEAQMIEEPGLQEIPFLPATAAGLAGLRVVQAVQVVGCGKSQVVHALQVDGFTQFAKSVYFLPGDPTIVGKPFLPSTPVGPVPRSVGSTGIVRTAHV